MDTYKKLLFWGATAGLGYVASAAASDGAGREDLVALTWVATVAVAGAVYAILALARSIRSRDAESARHDRLVDEALKVLLRQKLVSEHDRLVALGEANDTQLRAYEDSYVVYEDICAITGDRNGVVDSYREDVMSLPTPIKRRD